MRRGVEEEEQEGGSDAAGGEINPETPPPGRVIREGLKGCLSANAGGSERATDSANDRTDETRNHVQHATPKGASEHTWPASRCTQSARRTLPAYSCERRSLHASAWHLLLKGYKISQERKELVRSQRLVSPVHVRLVPSA